jgi:hypothetical protein
MKTKILSLAAIISVGLISCQKSNESVITALEEEQILKSAEISITDLKAESISNESSYEAEFYANSEQELRGIAGKKGRMGKLIDWKKDLRYKIGQCPNVSIDTADAGYPITITLNYGDSTVLENGRVLSGIITVEITGPKFTDGTTRTINYSGFSIDSVTIEGSIVETFTGDNTTSRKFSVNGDLTISLPDGTVLDRVSQNTHEWLQGIDTPLVFEDDVIQITGSVTNSSSNGDVFKKEIIEPLLKLGSCKYIVQGKTQITQNGEVISEIDFGNGDCDEHATLTTGGETIDIILKGNMPKADMGGRYLGKKGKGHSK